MLLLRLGRLQIEDEFQLASHLNILAVDELLGDFLDMLGVNDVLLGFDLISKNVFGPSLISLRVATSEASASGIL